MILAICSVHVGVSTQTVTGSDNDSRIVVYQHCLNWCTCTWCVCYFDAQIKKWRPRYEHLKTITSTFHLISTCIAAFVLCSATRTCLDTLVLDIRCACVGVPYLYLFRGDWFGWAGVAELAAIDLKARRMSVQKRFRSRRCTNDVRFLMLFAISRTNGEWRMFHNTYRCITRADIHVCF